MISLPMLSVPPDDFLDRCLPLSFVLVLLQPSSQSELSEALSLLSTAALSSPSSSVARRTPPPGAVAIPLEGSEPLRFGSEDKPPSERANAESESLRYAVSISMRFPESVTKVLFAGGAGGVGLSMRVAGDADLGPGEPDFDLPRGVFVELCLSLGFEDPRKPDVLPYTDDMARGFAAVSSLPP
jgi:hypothetical protein